MRLLKCAVFTLALVPALAAAENITGSVTYLQRMMLPPDSTLRVHVQDTTLADAPSKTLGTYEVENPGAPPYGFSFEIDPAMVDETQNYGLSATIHQGDRLLMTTDTAYPVLTQGAGNTVDMVLTMVASAEAEAKPDSDFVNTYWKIVTLNGAEVPVANAQREPHLILKSDGSYNATVGCNMILGGYSLDGETVAFKPGPMSLMACMPPIDAFERDLVNALSAAASFDVEGDSMKLVDGSGGALATFRAVYF